MNRGFEATAAAFAVLAVAISACTPAKEAAAPAGPAPAGGVAISAAGMKPEAGEASPQGRLLIGRGTDYTPIAQDPDALFNDLQGSMAHRRATAWKIVEALLQPQALKVSGKTYQVPLWNTWYESNGPNDEIGQRLQLFIADLAACQADKACKKSRAEIAHEALSDAANKNLVKTLVSGNFTQPLTQTKLVPGANPGDELGLGFTMFSPSFVEHALTNAETIEKCSFKTAWNKPPPSPTQFSTCLPEFPRSAVMLKTVWTQLTGPNPKLPDPDTSAAAVAKVINVAPTKDGTWPAPATALADPSKIYTVETTDGSRFGLTAMHISTKDTRVWVWVTLWWSSKPNEDFGQDRPAALAKYNGGVWSHYKMCVTTSFAEGDKDPGKSFETAQPGLAGALRKVHQTLVAQDGPGPGTPTTWCSNPNVEQQPGNSRTNCMGCHQESHTWNVAMNRPTAFNDTYDPGQDAQYPHYGRAKRRTNFPPDFSWMMSLEFPDAIKGARQSQNFKWPKTGGGH